MPKDRNEKDIKFKDAKEHRDIPWEERPGGNLFARILKSLMRTIKYVFDPEYRYTVKLMDQYAVKSAIQHDTYKTKEKTPVNKEQTNYKKKDRSFDKEHTNYKKKEKSYNKNYSKHRKKTFNKEIEPKEKVHDNQEKVVEKENDLPAITPEKAMEMFKEENAKGFDVAIDGININISLDNVLEHFNDNKIVFDDPQMYVKAANEYVNKEKDHIYAHDMFIKKYEERYHLSSDKDGRVGCDMQKLEEYFAKNDIKAYSVEEYEGHADKFLYKCIEENGLDIEEIRRVFDELDKVSKQTEELAKDEAIEEIENEKIVPFEVEDNKEFVADDYDEMEL